MGSGGYDVALKGSADGIFGHVARRFSKDNLPKRQLQRQLTPVQLDFGVQVVFEEPKITKSIFHGIGLRVDGLGDYDVTLKGSADGVFGHVAREQLVPGYGHLRGSLGCREGLGCLEGGAGCLDGGARGSLGCLEGSLGCLEGVFGHVAREQLVPGYRHLLRAPTSVTSSVGAPPISLR